MIRIILFLVLLMLASCGSIDGPSIIRPDTKQDCEARGGEWVDSSGGYCIETAMEEE